MRLTIFWRSILAQSILITLILLISLYSHSRLNALTDLGEVIVSRDSEFIKESKHALKVFLSQVRVGEKYVLFADSALSESFSAASIQFRDTCYKMFALAQEEDEKRTIQVIAGLHRNYVQEVEGVTGEEGIEDQRGENRRELSDQILVMIRDLIQFREESVAVKMKEARDLAADAAQRMFWIALAGISGALFLAFFHARSVSSPLRRLSKEMRRVGEGEFSRKIDMRAPREVDELARTFNWMTLRLGELDRLKSDFTAHFSHELRTPLTAIKEGSAILLDEFPGKLNDSQREILSVINSHTEQLSQAISSILDLSKMEAKMMEYEFAPCDLRNIFEKSVRRVDLIARRKMVSIDVLSDDNLPLLNLDELRIQQVLDNLLGNALKYTPSGGRIVLEVSVFHGNSEPLKELHVRVSDSGEGIPSDQQEMIFERYYQGTNSRGASTQGTGLGLALARYIVEAHGGRIWTENMPGSGATFLFSLPME